MVGGIVEVSSAIDLLSNYLPETKECYILVLQGEHMPGRMCLQGRMPALILLGLLSMTTALRLSLIEALHEARIDLYICTMAARNLISLHLDARGSDVIHH